MDYSNIGGMSVAAFDMIKQSVNDNVVVTAAWTEGVAAELYAACDDQTDRGEYVEYIGSDGEGNDWRVNLRRESVDQD